ncbi:MAG: acyltransferase family protein [Actinomycetota bacterium]
MKETSSAERRERSNDRIPGLDGLRGLAALTVLLSHMANNKLYLLPGLDFSGMGKPAVYLFFVLSSFLLTTQLWSRQPEELRNSRFWLAYLLGRTVRIWPLFLLYVAAGLITTQFGAPILHGDGLPEPFDLREAVDALTLRRVSGSILWTVLVEFKFYLMLPLIVGVLVFGLRKAVWWCLLALALAAVACFLAIPHDLEPLTPLPFLGIFLTGMFGAVLHTQLQALPLERWRRCFEAASWLSATLFVCLIPSVASRLLGMPVPTEYLRYAFGSFSALWLMLILGMLHGSGETRRLLERKTLIRLGTISYGLYLCHMSILKIVVWPRIPLPVGSRAWLGLAGALVLAALLFRLVEAPALAFGGRLRRALTRPREGVEAAV